MKLLVTLCLTLACWFCGLSHARQTGYSTSEEAFRDASTSPHHTNNLQLMADIPACSTSPAVTMVLHAAGEATARLWHVMDMGQQGTAGQSGLSSMAPLAATIEGDHMAQACASGPTQGLPLALFQGLCKARTPKGSALVTSGNAALVRAFLPLYIGSLRQSGTVDKHLLVIVYDAKAHAACSLLHDNCVVDDWASSRYRLGSIQDAEFGSSTFKSLTWRKVELLRDMIREGFSIFMSDMDIVWFRNPLAAAEALPAKDIYVSRESWRLENTFQANVGAYYIAPTESSLRLPDEWLSHNSRSSWIQRAFNIMVWEQTGWLQTALLPRNAFLSLCFFDEPGLPNFTVFRDIFRAAVREKGWAGTMVMFHCPCANIDIKEAVLATVLSEWYRYILPTTTLQVDISSVGEY